LSEDAVPQPEFLSTVSLTVPIDTVAREDMVSNNINRTRLRSPNAPLKLGKYELREIVGQGNMGTVYRAFDPYTGREVAIKVCAPNRIESDADERLRRRLFYNEAHTAGSLDHPNILSVYDAAEDDDIPYIVMELLSEAETLEKYCSPETLLPLDGVIEIVFHAARALDYAHRRGVVHRDIKPSNMMLSDGGDIKIGDFGIAERSQSEETQVLGMLGSPKYMSPEQVREESVNGQSDLYSLGVVFYELLTGRSPYKTDGLAGLLQAILACAPPPLADLRPGLPDELQPIISRALAKSCDDRYRSGAEFAADLAAMLNRTEEPERVSEDEKFTTLRQVGFFNEFSDPELWEVIRACRWHHYALGTEVVKEGSVESSFFVIVSGAVAVTKGGTQITTLISGDCFGEMAYLSKTARSATIVAQDDVSLLEVTENLMSHASLSCQLRFNRRFLDTLIARLTRTSAALSRK
jgi:serine/threonine protein kinase